MNLDIRPPKSGRNLKRIKFLAITFSILGISLFVYFIYSIGIQEILEGIGKIGIGGFLFVLFIHLIKVSIRSIAWKNCVAEGFELKFADTFPAVLMGEAMSSMVPLGILASGTTKALAVRHKVPLVVGLSSVATENLFYSFATGLLIVSGSIAFLFSFDLENPFLSMVYVVILSIFGLMVLAFIALLKQLHLASGLCNRISLLKGFSAEVKHFEDLIFSFYRQNTRRFIPLFLLHVVFNLLGICEVWFILSCIGESAPSFYSAFLLETISRLITVVFKLIPFVMGVDEAGATFISESLELGASLGVTLAIIRKGRLLSFALLGAFLLLKRGLSIREIIREN